MEGKAHIMIYEMRQHHYDVSTLIDSGCTTSAIDRDFVKKKKIPTLPLAKLRVVYNADRSKNANGPITEYVELFFEVNRHKERLDLMVTTLRSHSIFLGLEWLEHHNPEIDWMLHQLNFIRCPATCGEEHHSEFPEGERLFYLNSQSW